MIFMSSDGYGRYWITTFCMIPDNYSLRYQITTFFMILNGYGLRYRISAYTTKLCGGII